MSFSQDWLSLREPADHAARSPLLTQRLQQWAAAKTSLQILELGTGTGSNLRYLCPLLGHRQTWTVVDNDEALLLALSDRLVDWAESRGFAVQQDADTITVLHASFSASVRCLQQDMAAGLGSLPFAGMDLVTAAALLDLCSDAWLQQLSGLCLEHGCASLFVLNYDGRILWQPELAEDSTIHRLFNTHQGNDKGFGPSLGPAAGQRFAAALQQQQSVLLDASDWVLSSDDQRLQSALIDGLREASLEQGLLQASHEQDIIRDVINDWARRRHEINNESESNLLIGHGDVLALP